MLELAFCPLHKPSHELHLEADTAKLFWKATLKLLSRHKEDSEDRNEAVPRTYFNLAMDLAMDGLSLRHFILGFESPSWM